MASITLTPHDAHTAAAMLAHAADEQQRLTPCGHRTRLGPATPDDQTVPISSSLLTRGLEHYAGDLVATLPAGTTLRDVNAVLGAARQWLPLDPPAGDRATIGGVLASNASGPRRHRYGTPRDLIVGIEVALTSGRVVHAGGRVVKNVAGYDLARLFCGSQGSLGMITSATFKLAPVPRASRTVVARFGRTQHAAQFALDLAASPVTPSCIELEAPGARLLVRFESTPRAADQMAAAAAALLGTGSQDVVTVDGEREADLWREYGAGSPSNTIVTLSLLPTATAPLLDQLEPRANDAGLTWRVTARAALGIVEIHLGGEASAQLRGVDLARAIAHEHGGHVRVATALEEVRTGAAAWDPIGSAMTVSEAVKRQFDPAGVLPWPWERSTRV